MDAIRSLQLQKRYNLDARRMYRAANIVDQEQIRHLPSGVYEVVSQSRARLTHKVNPRYESCSCEDCTRGNLCIHLIAWLLVREQRTRVTDTYAKWLDPLPQVDPIAQREAQAKIERATRPRTEWQEELDFA